MTGFRKWCLQFILVFCLKPQRLHHLATTCPLWLEYWPLIPLLTQRDLQKVSPFYVKPCAEESVMNKHWYLPVLGSSPSPAPGNHWSAFCRCNFAFVCMLNHFSCVWLCDVMDCSPPGSSVLKISQARRLEWVAISSSRGSSRCRDWIHVSYVSCIGRQVLYH